MKQGQCGITVSLLLVGIAAYCTTALYGRASRAATANGDDHATTALSSTLGVNEAELDPRFRVTVPVRPGFEPREQR